MNKILHVLGSFVNVKTRLVCVFSSQVTSESLVLHHANLYQGDARTRCPEGGAKNTKKDRGGSKVMLKSPEPRTTSSREGVLKEQLLPRVCVCPLYHQHHISTNPRDNETESPLKDVCVLSAALHRLDPDGAEQQIGCCLRTVVKTSRKRPVSRFWLCCPLCDCFCGAVVTAANSCSALQHSHTLTSS